MSLIQLNLIDSAFKSSSNSSTTDALLSERNRIDHSHRMTDDVLGFVALHLLLEEFGSLTWFVGLVRQAYETRSAFAQQRRNITGIGARMNGVIGLFCYSGFLSLRHKP